MLKARNLVKRYGRFEAVRGINLEVQKGETFGLLGPNGAGKSTTIAMICGLKRPTEGEVTVGGVDVWRQPMAAKRLLGVVPQDIALYPTLSARENLLFWGAMYGLSGRALRSRVEEALEIVGLQDRQRERIETYSGGMKRRINIAAALLHGPELLIMDEPTVGIDPQSRSHILETVRRLNREMGMTVLYTSHYMEEVEYLCRRLAIMDHGQVIAQGSLDQVRQLAGTDATVYIRVSQSDERLAEVLAGVPGVGDVRLQEGQAAIRVAIPSETLPRLLEAAGRSGYEVTGLDVQEPNLESVFLHLTGRALRD